MESSILRVSYKIPEVFMIPTLQETQGIHDSMNIPKIEFIAHIYILLLISKI